MELTPALLVIWTAGLVLGTAGLALWRFVARKRAAAVGADDRHYLERLLEDMLVDMWPFIRVGSIDGIWFWDLKNPTEEWYDDRFVALLGVPQDEVVYTPDFWRDRIHPEDLELALRNYELHLEDPEGHPYLQLVRYRAGSERETRDGWVWVICRGMVWFDSDGEPEFMLGTHQDVTVLVQRMNDADARIAVLEQLTPLQCVVHECPKRKKADQDG